MNSKSMFHTPRRQKIMLSVAFSVLMLAIGVVAFLPSIALAENTNRSTAETVCSRSDVIFCENWEDGDSVGWTDFRLTAQGGSYIWGGQSCLVGNCDFPYPGYHSNHAMVVRMAANSPDTMYPYGRFNSPLGLDETVYYRYYVYWSPGFEFNVHANKNSYLVTDDATWRVAFQARPQKDGSSVSITSAIPYIHLYCGQIAVASGSWQESYCRDSGGDLRYWPNQAAFANFRFQSGRWYSIEVMMQPNPMGQSFGAHLSAWIDGQLAMDYQNDNISVRPASGATPLTAVWLNSYYGGGGQQTHPEQYVMYDNVIVSKSYIGPMRRSQEPASNNPGKPATPAAQ